MNKAIVPIVKPINSHFKEWKIFKPIQKTKHKFV